MMKLMIFVKIMASMTKFAYNTTTDTFRRVDFGSDGILFVMDNSANCHICTEKACFIDLHLFTELEKDALGSIGIVGNGAIPEGFRDVQLSWMDDEGEEHNYTIKDVFYVLNSPVNLIGVTKFGKQIEPKHEEFPEGTNIQTFINHSIFTWDRGRFKRTLIHLPCNIPTMFVNNGFKTLETLCTVLEKADNNLLHKAFMTDNMSDDASITNFMKELRNMVTGKDLTEEMACYYYYHNLLNHISLSNIHTLAKKGILQSKLLKIKSTPPCSSCLFGRVHRRPWRSKGAMKNIRKECQPGEECSVDQIVMSSPGLIPQTRGKPTKRRYVGSQITIDHATNFCHAAHLEDFMASETI